MAKPILCLDFDGVIHSYESGWHGADVVADGPVPGALEFLAEASRQFRIAVFSSRSGQLGGCEAMKGWLEKHLSSPSGAMPDWFLDIEWPTEKPPAFLTIDDRAITFTGEWPSIDTLKSFKPWNKR
jgi:hypothetical protein